eukprot:Nk52_evm1s2273 gene=Nk52_evmTU1s2273
MGKSRVEEEDDEACKSLSGTKSKPIEIDEETGQSENDTVGMKPQDEELNEEMIDDDQIQINIFTDTSPKSGSPAPPLQPHTQGKEQQRKRLRTLSALQNNSHNHSLSETEKSGTDENENGSGKLKGNQVKVVSTLGTATALSASTMSKYEEEDDEIDSDEEARLYGSIYYSSELDQTLENIVVKSSSSSAASSPMGRGKEGQQQEGNIGEGTGDGWGESGDGAAKGEEDNPNSGLWALLASKRASTSEGKRGKEVRSTGRSGVVSKRESGAEDFIVINDSSSEDEEGKKVLNGNEGEDGEILVPDTEGKKESEGSGATKNDIEGDKSEEEGSGDNELTGLYKDEETLSAVVRSRYFVPKALNATCYNCQRQGHLARDCPMEKREKPCFLCAQRGHRKKACPLDLCYRCFMPGHKSRDCDVPRSKLFHVSCRRCKGRGHTEKECHENWRQYHNTCRAGVKLTFHHWGANTDSLGGLTTGTGSNIMGGISCYNCSSEDHYGHECEYEYMDGPSHFNRVHLPFVQAYDHSHNYKPIYKVPIDRSTPGAASNILTNGSRGSGASVGNTNTGSSRSRNLKYNANNSRAGDFSFSGRSQSAERSHGGGNNYNLKRKERSRTPNNYNNSRNATVSHKRPRIGDSGGGRVKSKSPNKRFRGART